MRDDFSGHAVNPAGPANRMLAVAKADGDLPGGIAKALLVGMGGTANLMDAEGNLAANVPLQAGYNPLRVRQVRTGGTAMDIWALY